MAKCKHETQKGICEIHSSYSYCHLCDSENLCKGYEPKTNADRIRAMSDEELAWYMVYVTYNGKKKEPVAKAEFERWIKEEIVVEV